MMGWQRRLRKQRRQWTWASKDDVEISGSGSIGLSRTSGERAGRKGIRRSKWQVAGAVNPGVGTWSRRGWWRCTRLTGGVLILRNKFFIILFRGKDFLPGKVSDSVLEREAQVNGQHLLEENARSKSAESFHGICTSEISTSTTGSFREFKHILVKYIPLNNQLCMRNAQIAAEMENLKRTLREHEHSLFNVGRRGIYDGVIESIRQHWKHREIVKVVTVQKAIQQINHMARLLERESGGIVAAVEKQGHGHAIIIYWGRNYRRPLLPTHKNLLTKRQALQRSLEVQRRGSLRFFAKERQQCILEMRRKLRDLLSRQKRTKGFHSIDPKHPEDCKDTVG
ncbi:hypothetical protein KSP40_PGU012184 [Platanthera guangdongensis]|uniref:CRM domain-containing protein n=1 Tax=Platanthera guangdongensis TaxID=2320717 RepID=A0ABR2MCZ1_9ASPA